MRISYLFILCLLICPAHFCENIQGYSKEASDWISKYKHDFTDGFAATLSGVCNDLGISKEDFPFPAQTFELRNKHMESGILPVQILLQRNADGDYIKAPVVFYIPGAFNNLGDKQPNRWLYSMANLGYHVVTFPNPWGTEFQKLKPVKPVGDILGESAAIYEAIRQAHRVLKNQDLTNGIHRVAGVSYGSFLTAMVAAYDAEHKEPVHFLDATILSPPFNLGRTLDRLDTLIEESKDPFNGIDLVSLVIRFKRFCWRDNQSELNEYHLQSAKGLSVYEGFHSELVNSILAYDKVRNLNSIPGRRWGFLSPKFRKWKRNLNFDSYFKTYSPETKELLTSEKGDLLHWVNQAKAAGFNNFRIFAADDDFLNEFSVWDLQSKRVALVPDGGHYGYRHLQWFARFLEILFDPTSKEMRFEKLHQGE